MKSSEYPISNENMINHLTESISATGHSPQTEEIPVFYFSTAVWVYLISNLVTLAIGFFQPLLGLVGSLVLWVLFLKEFFTPTLGRFLAGRTKNISVTIPARSKEGQQLFLVTTYGTDEIYQIPFKFNLRTYSIVLTLLGAIVVGIQMINLQIPFLYSPILALIPLLVMAVFNIVAVRNSPKPKPPITPELLTEVVNVLSKIRALTTTVTFCFLGTRSAHSGMLSILKKIKSGPELTYVVNLSETDVTSPEMNIQWLKTEGIFFPKKSDPILSVLLTEVAHEKGISFSVSNNHSLTEGFLLLHQKQKAGTLQVPIQSDKSNQKELRELLLGLIRKLDH